MTTTAGLPNSEANFPEVKKVKGPSGNLPDSMAYHFNANQVREFFSLVPGTGRSVHFLTISICGEKRKEGTRKKVAKDGPISHESKGKQKQT